MLTGGPFSGNRVPTSCIRCAEPGYSWGASSMSRARELRAAPTSDGEINPSDCVWTVYSHSSNEAKSKSLHTVLCKIRLNALCYQCRHRKPIRPSDGRFQSSHARRHPPRATVAHVHPPCSDRRLTSSHQTTLAKSTSRVHVSGTRDGRRKLAERAIEK